MQHIDKLLQNTHWKCTRSTGRIKYFAIINGFNKRLSFTISKRMLFFGIGKENIEPNIGIIFFHR